MPTDTLEQRLAEARYARERYELYRARLYGGSRAASLVRLRELERVSEQAAARLRHAQAGSREESS